MQHSLPDAAVGTNRGYLPCRPAAAACHLTGGYESWRSGHGGPRRRGDPAPFRWWLTERPLCRCLPGRVTQRCWQGRYRGGASQCDRDGSGLRNGCRRRWRSALAETQRCHTPGGGVRQTCAWHTLTTMRAGHGFGKRRRARVQRQGLHPLRTLHPPPLFRSALLSGTRGTGSWRRWQLHASRAQGPAGAGAMTPWRSCTGWRWSSATSCGTGGSATHGTQGACMRSCVHAFVCVWEGGGCSRNLCVHCAGLCAAPLGQVGGLCCTACSRWPPCGYATHPLP